MSVSKDQVKRTIAAVSDERALEVGQQHPRMERKRRAKQFLPFDALDGFREALAEKERSLVARKELSEERCEELDQKLRQLQTMDWVAAEYFLDGAYVWVEGFVAKIDPKQKILQIADTEIPFCDLSDLQGAFWLQA